MRIVFFGTPDFAVPSLRLLISRHDVCAVVTQPDKPKGRGKKLLPPPVKEEAVKEGIEVLQPDRIRDGTFFDRLSEMNADIYVVAAYGRIFPESLLKLPRLGCVCVHASLLPKYRGAAPIQWAIINGEATTGITIMYMEKGIDTGDMILKRELAIEPGDNYGTLHDKMAMLGASALADALPSLENGTAIREKQVHDQASYAHMIIKEMGHIDWNWDADRINNLIRGLTPSPGAYTYCNGEILKLCQGEIVYVEERGEPGEIIYLGSGRSGALPDSPPGIVVKTGRGCYCITELQASGGKRMKASDYLRGHALETGIVLKG